MARMHFIRKNWMALVFFAAVVAFFVVSNAESKGRDQAQHVQLVQGCLRGSQRNALLASYQHRTAEARRQAGDSQIADDYDGYAKGTIDTIPAPNGTPVGDPALVEVRRIMLPNGHYKFVLTARAMVLQKAGCEQANTRH